MAKDMLKKKQRIAHNKTLNNEHKIYSECDDFLSTIIEGMDKNDLLTVMDFNKFDADLSEFNKTSVEKKTQINTIPISKQNRPNIQKSKTFGLSRKFPLMEKSQRALKQIRHNRKIPKPRAHLAGLSNCLLEDDQQFFDTEKSKKTKVVAKNSNKFQNKKAIEKLSCHGVRSQVNSIKIKPAEKVSEKIAHKHELPVTNKKATSNKKGFSNLEQGISKNEPLKSKADFKEYVEKDEYDKTRDNSTDSDDYESFIRKEKKMLPKKSKNHKDIRKKQNSPPKASKKRASKAKPKTIISETDSDQSDEESKSYYKNKRIKSSHKVLDKPSSITLENSESEMDLINDETYHNSSSDSDELLPLSQIVDNLQSNNLNSKQIDTEHNSTPELNCSSHQTSAIISSVNSDNSDNFSPTVCGISSMNNIQLNVSCETSNKLASSMTLSEGDHSNVFDNDQSNVSCPITKNDSVIRNTSKHENSNESIIVDLTESDNEVGNSFTVMPKIVMSCSQALSDSPEYSEESDIELVDVILPEMLQTDAKSLDKNVKPSFSNENSIDKLNIKTEVNQTPPCTSQNNLKPIDELHTSLSRNNLQSKCEITHATDKNQGYGKNEFKDTSRQLNFNNDKLQSNISSNKECSFVLNKVKEEPSDIEIILDTGSISNSTQNLPNVQVCSNKSIKTEKNSKAVEQTSAVRIVDDCIATSKNKLEKDQKPHEVCIVDDCIDTSKNKLLEKEQKLHEVACSNLKNLTNMHNANLASLEKEKMSELHSIDIKAALQDLKKEFATYQEILQTEQSVGATFKMLERCQAEKLKALKTRITKCLGSSSIDSDIDTIKNTMNKMLANSKLTNPLEKVQTVCLSKNISDISVQNLKDGNLVPLSSISANDVKPDLTELQHSIKKEPTTSDEISKSFGQICIVCAKPAAAACQRCAKVFFCSNECGKKYWDDGHRNNCISGSS